MLTRFEVTNFKSFHEKFEFDFTNINDFQFNLECIKDGAVRKGIIYGANGSGKSNLGLAIFDVVSHLAGSNVFLYSERFYQHYLNAFAVSDIAEFRYVFSFGNNVVEYCYGKYNLRTFAHEELKINGEVVISLDRRKTKKATVNLKGAENLNTDISGSDISIVNYVHKNTILKRTIKKNRIFYEFIKFIEGMLFFRCLSDGNRYLGADKSHEDILVSIIERNHIDDFQSFLNMAGVECKLDVIELNGINTLAFVFKDKKIYFWDVASTGTQSLALLYYWLQQLKENGQYSFVFIDEFDAFYHHELSELVVKQLKLVEAQVVLTTHNTSIMSNDLLRPDCYFVMNNKTIKPLSKCTEKELRVAHNLEKMYKAGAFNV